MTNFTLIHLFSIDLISLLGTMTASSKYILTLREGTGDTKLNK